jgi:replication fork protection complex subunit Tof1/Swi1
VALFKDNKLRLLMTLVGFSRLGDTHNPDATWIVPSLLTSAQLHEALDLIRKFEFDPPTYEDGKQAEDLIRSKAAGARRSSRRADYDDDDDDDGIDNNVEVDLGEYGPSEPTARRPDGSRKKLQRRRQAGTPVELDDEEKDRRAEARRKKEIEKLTKAFKSTEFVHDSDDEDDTAKDAEFFAREQALRDNTFKNPSTNGTETEASRKRKAGEPEERSKRRKTPPKRKRQAFDNDSEDDDEEMGDAASASSRALSEQARDVLDEISEIGTTDTPLSSQHVDVSNESDGDTPRRPVTTASVKSLDVSMADADDDDDDDDAAPMVRRPAARNTRNAFVIDSDSE